MPSVDSRWKREGKPIRSLTTERPIHLQKGTIQWQTEIGSSEQGRGTRITVRWDNSTPGCQESVLPSATVVSRRGSRDGGLLSELLC